ncbi:hypothetical protein FKM82_015358 [Ascaphus truei]
MAGGEEGQVLADTQVSYIGHDCTEIPTSLGRKYGHLAKRLDLSFNLLRSNLLSIPTFTWAGSRFAF